MNANAAQLLWESAVRHSARPALRAEGVEVDHDGLRRRAAEVAGALRAAGIDPGDRVGIFLERGVEAAAAFFGVLAAGAVAVMVNEALRPRQVEHLLAHAGAKLLLTDDTLLARQPRPITGGFTVLTLGTLPGSRADADPPVERLGPDPAQIVYTSGSTGAPKGVTVTHANLAAAAGTVVDYLGLEPGDRIAGLLTFSSVYGMSQLLCTVRAGACLVVERSTLPRTIVDTIERERVSVLAAVPPLWLRLLNGGGLRDRRLPDLRVVTNAGGHLPVDAVRVLRSAHPDARLYLMYGLTEVLRSTYLPPEEVDRRPDSMGRAIPGAEVYVVDEDGRPVPRGSVGELVHRGPTVTRGYWNDPALTARVYRPLPGITAPGECAVFSGDLVRQDAEGFLYYVSRRDRLIKTMGFRVGPDEVIDVLIASGEVAEAEVVGEPDPVWGTRIAAHVVLGAGGDLGRLKAFCGRELPRHMQPARFVAHDALPLLPSGKHDLAALAGAGAE